MSKENVVVIINIVTLYRLSGHQSKGEILKTWCQLNYVYFPDGSGKHIVSNTKYHVVK